MSAREQIEAIAGMVVLPLPVAARILGTTARALAKDVPVIRSGYRSKGVAIAAMRDYLDRNTDTPANAPRKFRILNHPTQ